jgi:Mg2+/citrate symporter
MEKLIFIDIRQMLMNSIMKLENIFTKITCILIHVNYKCLKAINRWRH